MQRSLTVADVNFVSLQTAVFCVQCEMLSDNNTPRCLACGSGAVLSLSRVLGGSLRGQQTTHLIADAELPNKLKAIEDCDGRLARTFLDEYKKVHRDDLRVMVLPDHPVPIKLRKHTRTPVPFMVAGAGVKNDPAIERYGAKLVYLIPTFQEAAPGQGRQAPGLGHRHQGRVLEQDLEPRVHRRLGPGRPEPHQGLAGRQLMDLLFSPTVI